MNSERWAVSGNPTEAPGSAFAPTVILRLLFAVHCLPSYVGHLDLAQRGRLGGADLGITVGARAPDAPDRGADLLVRRAAAHERAQIVSGGREQAGVDHAVGREARAAAVAAKSLGHRRDAADLAAPVPVMPALGDLPGVVRVGGVEGGF